MGGSTEKQESPQEEVPRLSSGTPHLDQLLAGGWLRGGTHIVTGPPGTGKPPKLLQALERRSRKPGGRE